MANDWLELHAPAPLPVLYMRALLRRSVRGDSLPEQGLRCPVQVDREHLQRYRRLCGFADDALLPPTYPHLLAFPLQLQLLTAKAFPLPLLGLVHLENRIRVVRPLAGLGPFAISVQVQHLRPHAKGVVFSLITRLEDQLGLLWEADSLFLSRALTSAGIPVAGNSAAGAPLADTPLAGTPDERSDEQALPLSLLAQWPAPAGVGRAYARLSGDCNPIHLHALSARLFGFPRAIAHGLWAKGRALAVLDAQLPDAGYSVAVRFQKPVLLPTELHLLASNPASNGQFSLQGPEQTTHMRGNWQLI